MTSKLDVLQTFKHFKTLAENSLEHKIKALQYDMKGEFKPFEKLLLEQGISPRYSCPYTHHQNRKVERKYRHLVETGPTLLTQASIPLKFWWEAFCIIVYFINTLPTPTLENTLPYEALFSTKPDNSY